MLNNILIPVFTIGLLVLTVYCGVKVYSYIKSL